jgi:hypothetical protein
MSRSRFTVIENQNFCAESDRFSSRNKIKTYLETKYFYLEKVFLIYVYRGAVSADDGKATVAMETMVVAMLSDNT